MTSWRHCFPPLCLMNTEIVKNLMKILENSYTMSLLYHIKRALRHQIKYPSTTASFAIGTSQIFQGIPKVWHTSNISPLFAPKGHHHILQQWIPQINNTFCQGVLCVVAFGLNLLPINLIRIPSLGTEISPHLLFPHHSSVFIPVSCSLCYLLSKLKSHKWLTLFKQVHKGLNEQVCLDLMKKDWLMQLRRGSSTNKMTPQRRP